MIWITASDIGHWVKTRRKECESDLPELVRRLIWATTIQIEEIDFPAGDSTNNSGWDGRLKTVAISTFFPEGTSGWELSVNNAPGTKAEKDYKSRTANGAGLSRSETTFVFVTPHPWPGRVQWAAKKHITKKWKGIRVIAADGLEQWLAVSPAVALWLARKIGKVNSDGVQDIEGVWEEWSLATNPTMTPGIVISGRLKEVEEIHRWLSQPPSIFELQGDAPGESVAFLYGSIAALPDNDRTRALSRCVVVENIQEFRNVYKAFQSPLIIVAPGDCVEAAGAAMDKGHHVFLNVDAKVIDFNKVIKLSRPQRGALEGALHEAGLNEADSQRLARDSGRSISVLRRHISRSQAVRAPRWSIKLARTLLPILLAGAWKEGNEGDREVVESLSRMGYSDFTKKLNTLLDIQDSPIRKVGDVWTLKAPLDAWFLLAKELDNDDLKLFRQCLVSVLSKTDPKYELSADKRWAAAIYGKSNPYSEWLRRGLVESLVLLAVYQDRARVNAEDFVDAVVSEIFSTANSWEAWSSLSDVTPLLIEAAPNAFLRILEEKVKENPIVFQELMKDEDTAFGECKHSGLLWALESAAWNPEYFFPSVKALSSLAKIDPGGKWSNRPANSLKDIFQPGFPQTFATPEQRLEGFDFIARTEPEIAWKFSEEFFEGGSFSESHRFRWRTSGGERSGLTPESAEYQREFINGLIPKLVQLSTSPVKNLVASTKGFIRLPLDVRNHVLEKLKTLDSQKLSKENRAELLENLRDILNWINSHGSKEMRLHVPPLNLALKRLTPKDVLERVGWLLSNPWPTLPEGGLRHGKDAVVVKARAKAARDVLDKVSLPKILDYADTVQYVGVLGHALGTVIKGEKEDHATLDAMLSRFDKNPGLVKGFALGRVESVGQKWVSKQVRRLKQQRNYSPDSTAALFYGLPMESTTWKAVSEAGEVIEKAYWKQMQDRIFPKTSEEAAIAVEKLLENNQPDIALSVAGTTGISLPSSLLQRLIQSLISDTQAKKPRPQVMFVYSLTLVFNQLYQRNELPPEELAKLEWPFASAFDDLMRHASAPLAIHRVLQKDPSFFVQLVSFIYKRDDHALDPDNSLNEKQKENLYKNARAVLSSWNLIPGLKDNGVLEEKGLTEWIDAVRQKCAEINKVIGGDLQISEVLARAPAGSDGIWPHVAVRNLIERLSNPTIEKHIPIAIYNNRGVVTRKLDSGGRQERELAANYLRMSEVVKAKWPRTSQMLRYLADSHDRDAKHQDVSSELRDLEW